MDTHPLQKSLDDLSNDVRALVRETKLSRWTIFRSFIMGVMYGLGATVGLTILLGLASLIINKFGGTPLIGEFLIRFGSYLHR